MDLISVGRTVLFGLGTRSGDIVERPAIVVRVRVDDPPSGRVNIEVFTDGSNDDAVLNDDEKSARDERRKARSIVWRTSVMPADNHGSAQVGRWRWPPRAPQAVASREAQP